MFFLQPRREIRWVKKHALFPRLPSEFDLPDKLINEVKRCCSTIVSLKLKAYNTPCQFHRAMPQSSAETRHTNLNYVTSIAAYALLHQLCIVPKVEEISMNQGDATLFRGSLMEVFDVSSHVSPLAIVSDVVPKCRRRFDKVGSVLRATADSDSDDSHLLVNPDPLTMTNFVLVENLPNSEQQIFIQIGQQSIRQNDEQNSDREQNETEIKMATATTTGSWMHMLTLSNSTQPGVSLLVTGDQRHVVKSIYRVDRQLLDCDLLDSDGATKALNDFHAEIARVLSSGSYQFRHLNESVFNLTDEQSDWLNVTKQRESCHQLQRIVRRSRRLHRKQLRRSLNAKSSRAPSISTNDLCGNWLHQASSSSDVRSETKKCCFIHKSCSFTIPPFTSDYHLFNYRSHTLIHCDCTKQ
ncbi:unnamed protein product [Soboliphyme baturini]|uniref:PA2c domain-containing protein n=1 Tax=Soboliphyme baturini TaxID=241478 RepID=A0A183J083_9BILA|nr:unnamed protein product [Soboliphyme baturini]